MQWITLFVMLIWSRPNLLTGNLPEENIKFVNYGVAEGLSQSTVLSSYQDAHGFVWLGTRDGLNLFDGHKFTVFRNRPGDTLSILDNHINDIKGDKNGNIWIATNEGMCSYHPDRPFFLNYELNIKGTDPEIRTIHIFGNDKIWVGSKDGILCFDKNKQAFYKPDHPIIRAVKENYVTSIYSNTLGDIWVGTTEGLYYFDADNKKVRWFHPDKKSEFNVAHERIEAIVGDENGNVWIGTYGGGVTLFNLKEATALHLNTESTGSFKLTNDFVRSLALDRNQNLWIGTFEGLNIYDNKNERITRVLHDPIKKDGLRHGSVRSLMVDSKGSVWVGTYMGGVGYFDQDNQRFSHFYHIPEKTTSLGHNVVSDFVQDRQGNYFIATERGGLSYYKTDQNAFERISAYPKNTIKSLLMDDAENLWIGTFKDGLHLYDAKRGDVKSFGQIDEHGHTATASINDMMIDRQGYLWLATDKNGGLYKFDRSEALFIDFELQDTLHQILKNHRIMSMMQDHLGNFWLATQGKGIVVFDPIEKRIAQYKANGKAGALNSNDINHIFTDSKGRIWVATTGGGINLFDRQKEGFSAYTTEHGLQNNTVIGTIEDDNGNLWISCINGISRLRLSNFSFKNYDYSSGLPLQEINEGAFFKAANGDILIGGNNGFIKFHPSDIRDNDFIPKVKITDFKISNHSVRPGQENGVLKKNIMGTESLTLEYDQSNFTIDFILLSFLKPEKNQYKYRLEGLEENWNFVGNTKSASYTNLQEGDYTFMVMGANNDMKWNSEPTILKIHIKPPMWKSWWAMLGYLLVITSGLFTIRQISRKSMAMQNEIRNKEMENARLEERHRLKLQSFTDVSHEFRTPLTLIIDPLQQTLENIEKDNPLKRRLEMVYFNARRLLLLINQILEISALDSGTVDLKNRPTDISLLAKSIYKNFQSIANANNISLTYRDSLPNIHLEADQDKLEKILYNLISNALKFNRSGGEILFALNCTHQNDTEIDVEIKVQDSGVGIDDEAKERVFERFYKGDGTKGTGIGLSLTKSLVGLMHGNIQLESEVGKGSTFIVDIPFKKSKANRSGFQQEFKKELPIGYINGHILKGDDPKIEAEEIDDLERNTYKVLLVEDDQELRHYLKENLDRYYTVFTAKNGVGGLEKAKKKSPDIILSDVMMPKMDGIELCEKIKSDPKLCHIPIVLLTAKTNDKDKLHGFEHGADDYIDKPFILRELKIRVDNILKNRKKLRERYIKDVNYSGPKIELNSYDEKLLDKIREIIYREIDSPELNVDSLGKEVGLSRVHLYRKLKSLTGQSPSNFIKDIRMNLAAELLQQNKVNISEVAFRVGFQDQFYFGKCFKNRFGVSPTDYAKQLQEQ